MYVRVGIITVSAHKTMYCILWYVHINNCLMKYPNYVMDNFIFPNMEVLPTYFSVKLCNYCIHSYVGT